MTSNLETLKRKRAGMRMQTTKLFNKIEMALLDETISIEEKFDLLNICGRKINYVTQNSNDSSKILGLLWDTNSDVLRFDVQSFPDDWKFNPTKRLVLKAMLKIFDPIGFIAPFSIRMKMLLQETWQKDLQRDDNLPRDLKDAWEN
ncbi:hypothetical protein TNCT_401521 [Trichonephila clavata]|uniref:Uncharacterized protein n=1 Tax=Trichonephila clavata TaxID=2740835 RepID=A0A8X6HD83_TRICU|nr:hypothetical protein TNCT_401521 [Trichonephila clavata]